MIPAIIPQFLPYDKTGKVYTTQKELDFFTGKLCGSFSSDGYCSAEQLKTFLSCPSHIIDEKYPDNGYGLHKYHTCHKWLQENDIGDIFLFFFSYFSY